jgi:antitoxin component of RelBE/YafQ-DinJ toxin-antitoxin module
MQHVLQHMGLDISRLYNVLRLVARKFNDKGIPLRSIIQRLPFKVVDENDRPVIQLEHKGTLRKFVSIRFCSRFTHLITE